MSVKLNILFPSNHVIVTISMCKLDTNCQAAHVVLPMFSLLCYHYS